MKANKRNRKQHAAAQPPAPPNMDETIATLYEKVTTSAEANGLQCVLIIQSPDGAWRGRWGNMPLDWGMMLVLKMLTAMQRMLP